MDFLELPGTQIAARYEDMLSMYHGNVVILARRATYRAGLLDEDRFGNPSNSANRSPLFAFSGHLDFLKDLFILKTTHKLNEQARRIVDHGVERIDATFRREGSLGNRR